MEIISDIIILLIITSPMIIVSLIVTCCCFRKNCSIINFFVYLFFNLAIIVILFFPFVVLYDYYIYFQEYLKISENSEYDEIKELIKIFYKVVHYSFYIFSDVLIPFGTNFYLLNYSEKKFKFKMSLSIFKSFLFFLLFMIVCAIVIVVLILYYPDPEIDDIEKNYEGWDGFIFNLRNICSLFEIEYYIMLFYYYIYTKGCYRFCWLAYCPCCKNSEISETKKNLFTLWTLGRLTKEDDDLKYSGSNDELNEIELALEDMKEKRKNDLIQKTMDELSNKPCLKVLKDIPLSFLSIIFGLCISEFEIHNSTNGIFINFKTLKSDWEKNEEDHEKIIRDINSNLVFYFFYSYFYIFILIYMIFQKKYIKEYLPYIGGKNNGFGLLILLRLILKKVLSINYLIFFPIINNGHKAIIHSYFKMISFSIDAVWVIIIKAAIMIFPFFFLLCNCAHDDLFDILKKGENNDCVKSGIKYFNNHTPDYKKHFLENS